MIHFENVNMTYQDAMSLFADGHSFPPIRTSDGWYMGVLHLRDGVGRVPVMQRTPTIFLEDAQYYDEEYGVTNLDIPKPVDFTEVFSHVTFDDNGGFTIDDCAIDIIKAYLINTGQCDPYYYSGKDQLDIAVYNYTMCLIYHYGFLTPNERIFNGVDKLELLSHFTLDRRVSEKITDAKSLFDFLDRWLKEHEGTLKRSYANAHHTDFIKGVASIFTDVVAEVLKREEDVKINNIS